jgi:hypothetical protein
MDVGARGEDWTGFLLGPLGVVLSATAFVVLWRSRKAGRLRYLRRAGIALVCVLAAYWLVLPSASRFSPAIVRAPMSRLPTSAARFAR